MPVLPRTDPAPSRKPWPGRAVVLKAVLARVLVMTVAALGPMVLGPAVAQAPSQDAPAAATAPQQASPAPAQPANGDDTGDDGGNGNQAQPPAAQNGNSVSAIAIDLPVPVQEVLRSASQRLDGVRVIFDQTEAGLLRDELDQEDINELRERVAPLVEEVRDLIAAIEPSLDLLRARQRELGPVPEEGATQEAQSIREARAALSELVNEIDAVVKRGQLLITRGDQILQALTERRRQLFARTFTTRGPSILSPELWRQVVDDVPAAAHALMLLTVDSSRVFLSRITPVKGAVLALAVIASLVLITLVRRRLLRVIIRDSQIDAPSDFAKALGAAWVALLYFLLPFLSIAILLASIELLDLLPDRASQLLLGIASALWVYFFLTALARALLAPGTSGWRLTPYDDATAFKLYALSVTIACVFAVDQLLDVVLNVVASPLEVDVAVTAVAAMVMALLAILSLRTAAHSRAEAVEATDDDAPPPLSAWRVIMRIILWAVSLTIIGAALVGYAALASFMATQAISALAVLAILAIVLLIVDQGFERLGDPTRPMSRALTRSLGVDGAVIGQSSALLSGIVKLSLIIIAAVTLMAPWGFDPSDWLNWFRSAFFGFRVGGVTISISTILAALALFALGIIITRAFQRWLETKYLPRTKFDSGIRASLKTAAGYLGIVAAAAFAITFVGIDLANIAIIAGALSVGVGFGLQSIVNNFVSGLILLAERPIKVGDWISVSGEQGYVRDISVRATQIETFDRATVVVPNSDLISGVVKNMMLNNMMGRVVIRIGVAYGSDVDKVRDVLLDCAKAHDRVLSYPAPNVFFMDFGESSLDFALYAYIPDVDYVLTVHSDLRFAILRGFREAGIEIPFPQRDLHLRSTVTGQPAIDTEPSTPEPPARPAMET